MSDHYNRINQYKSIPLHCYVKDHINQYESIQLYCYVKEKEKTRSSSYELIFTTGLIVLVLILRGQAQSF